MSPSHAALLQSIQTMGLSRADVSAALRMNVALQAFGHLTSTLILHGTHGLVWEKTQLDAAAMTAFYAADVFLEIAKIAPEKLAEIMRTPAAAICPPTPEGL